MPHIPVLVTQLGVLKALKKIKVMTVILLGETSTTSFLTHHQPELKTLQASPIENRTEVNQLHVKEKQEKPWVSQEGSASSSLETLL